MDGWNAPMWVDFDASVMSDIDEYFNVEHEELESEQSGEVTYHSCPNTPKSKKAVVASPYKTPKAGSTLNSPDMSSYMKALQINAEKHLLKGKLSMTPRNYVLKKACLRSTRSSTPRVTGNDSKRSINTEEKDKKVSKDDEEASKHIQVEKASEENPEISEIANDEDENDDNTEQNRTLIAVVETEENLTGKKESIVAGKTCAKRQSESSKSSECSLTVKESKVSAVAEETQDSALSKEAEKSTEKKEENPRGEKESKIASEFCTKAESESPEESEDSPTTHESDDTAVAKRTEDSGTTEKTADLATEKAAEEVGTEKEIKDPKASVVHESQIEISPEQNKEISVDSSTAKVAPPATKATTAMTSNEVKTKFNKLTNCEDPLKRAALDKKKNVRSKPTVLTSLARRQSTSKYRRVSGKYVSLAEAVSKFQHGTPERFRSSNNKDSKATNAAGPLQKVRHAALKITCATSPLLRCKYRTRGVSALTQEERAIAEMEEVRKNRLKPNPIKQSIIKPGKKVESISKSKKTLAMNDAAKKTDKKPAGLPEALSSTNKPTMDRSNPLKKITDSTTIKVNATSKCKETMKPTKTSDETKKLTAPLNIKPLSRRTMMNPPKVTKKVDEIATASGKLSSSRRTMMDPPKASTKIDKPTTIPESLSLGNKTPMKPPSSAMPESASKHVPCKKTVTTIVTTEDGAAIKDVEILHFGIPVGNDYKRFTKTVPFSFETRAKELKEKKEKLKNRDTEQTKKPKTFHARPVPSYIKTTTTVVNKPLSKPPVMPDAPFSFQQRNENLLMKKKEMFEKMLEREKQARIFHAKPAPNFKPVFVRGASAENLRDNNSTEKGCKITKETRRRGLSQSSIIDNRENIAPNTVTTSQPLFPKLKIPLMASGGKLKKTAT